MLEIWEKKCGMHVLCVHRHCRRSSYADTVVWLLSCVGLFETPWTAAFQASLSFTIAQSLLRFMSVESVMPPNHLILCFSLLLLSSVFPNIKVFSSELTLCIRWPKYWSFSFSVSPSSEYSRLISFRMDWLDLLAVQGTLKSLLQNHNSKASILWLLGLIYGPTWDILGVLPVGRNWAILLDKNSESSAKTHDRQYRLLNRGLIGEWLNLKLSNAWQCHAEKEQQISFPSNFVWGWVFSSEIQALVKHRQGRFREGVRFYGSSQWWGLWSISDVCRGQKWNHNRSHVFAVPELKGRIKQKFQPMWWRKSLGTGLRESWWFGFSLRITH